MKITDAQIHLWTNDQAPPHHWRAPNPIDKALADMKEAGVDAVINHPATWDPGSNDYGVEASMRHPDKFATLGWFPLDETANESRVEEWLAKPGMLGLRFILALPENSERFETDALDWLWSAANERSVPVGVFVLPGQLSRLGEIATRFPNVRFLIDHLSVFPHVSLPEAAAHFDALTDLARFSNIGVKATAVPSMSNKSFPFGDTHALLRRIFDAYGAERMFWGSDITRLRCSWRECVQQFTDELSWLKGRDLELVMGQAVRNWIGWH